ncbi:hypothetical protein VTK56DRAFT_9387 [Thermocarpiscus australiensis]
MCSSYPLPSRRGASSSTTISTTPVHVAAKAPRLMMCQDRERKQASMVYQFQSICGRGSYGETVELGGFIRGSRMGTYRDLVIRARGAAVVAVIYFSPILIRKEGGVSCDAGCGRNLEYFLFRVTGWRGRRDLPAGIINGKEADRTSQVGVRTKDCVRGRRGWLNRGCLQLR